MIRVRTFRAPDDPETSEKFLIGHRRILEIHYGIIKVTSDNTEWLEDPYSVVIVVEDPHTGKVLGGTRMQVLELGKQLPIETAVSKYDERIHQVVANDTFAGGTCEMCGMWNSKEIAGMGIGSHLLVHLGVAVSAQLNVKSVFALCAPSTVKATLRSGMLLEESVGDNGTFLYPKDNFVATVTRLRDIQDLSHAGTEEAARIIRLRNNLTQVYMEKGPRGTFEVEYDLFLKNWHQEGIWQNH
ncbi:hypothetical protein [Niabella beijingensis]|uniref:hypothetical protein n=1 Tax=Niabella beijingensis TaxID=2872700 RepID=UPI001CBCD0BD|nr:hypothetical protein [Niabella beijingensis]MBZ4187575.1 hypothetical protein [Niabella beijingensis]